MNNLTWEEAMEEAEELMKVFDQISRECFEREQDVVETFVIG